MCQIFMFPLYVTERYGRSTKRNTGHAGVLYHVVSIVKLIKENHLVEHSSVDSNIGQHTVSCLG